MPSYSNITTRLFGASYSTALQLCGNDYIKPLAISEHWTRLRLGLLVTISDIGAVALPSCNLIAGFCSSGKSYYSSNAAFAGWLMGRSTTADLTYTANSGSPYYTTTNFDAIIRVGITNSGSTVGSPNHYLPISTVGNPRCGLYIVDVTKGTTSFTIGGYTGAIAHMSLNLGMADLFDALEQPATTPIVRGTSLSVLTFQNASLPYNEQTYGYLNCVNLFWNRIAYPLEIYGIAVYEVY